MQPTGAARCLSSALAKGDLDGCGAARQPGAGPSPLPTAPPPCRPRRRPCWTATARARRSCLAIDSIGRGVQGDLRGVTEGLSLLRAGRAGRHRAADGAGTDDPGTTGLGRMPGPPRTHAAGFPPSLTPAPPKLGQRATPILPMAATCPISPTGWSAKAQTLPLPTAQAVEDYLVHCDAQGLSKATRARRLSVDPPALPLCGRGRLARGQPRPAPCRSRSRAMPAEDAERGRGHPPDGRRPHPGPQRRATGCAIPPCSSCSMPPACGSANWSACRSPPSGAIRG